MLTIQPEMVRASEADEREVLHVRIVGAIDIVHNHQP